MSYQLLALLLLPLIGSAVVFALKGSTARTAALVFTFAQMLLTFAIVTTFNSAPTVDSALQHEINWPWSNYIKSSIHFGIDGLTMVMLLLTNILVPLIILSSYNENKQYPASFYALILMMQFGLVGVFTALDGLLFYAFWEITLIPIWFIAGIWGREDKKLEFTTKFFVYTFVGSLFMLAGLIYAYSHAASFALTDLYSAQLNSSEQTVVFWFIFFAFMVKLPLFPVHTWQADTYSYSPTQGTMLLSGIMLKMAVFGLLRWLLPITPDAINGTSGSIALLLCVFGVLHGALIAITQNDSKRLIAYSSLSHVGLIAAGIFASAAMTLNGKLTYEGASGAMIQSFAHGINVVGLFYCADILYKRFKTNDIRQMGGLATAAPKFAVLFMIILFGSLAVPLTNGFIGEFILIKSIFSYKPMLGTLAGLTIILAAAYLLRFYAKTMFGKGDERILGSLQDLSSVEFTVLASLSVFVIVLGVFPQPLMEMTTTSLKFIYQTMALNHAK